MQPDPGVPPPDHVDFDGPWWALGHIPARLGYEREARDAEQTLSHWWMRQLPDGTIQARHRRSRAVRDVTIEPDTQEPGRMLVALCYSAEAQAKRRLY